MLKPPRCHHFPPLCHLYQISKKINGFNSKYFPSYVGDKTWTGKSVTVRRTLKLNAKKVVNTSNDMFDENYYRLTILGNGFIARNCDIFK